MYLEVCNIALILACSRTSACIGFVVGPSNITYNIQDIIVERQEKGVPKYLLRWKGFGPEDDTWEPVEHLAGAEDYIARFVEESVYWLLSTLILYACNTHCREWKGLT